MKKILYTLLLLPLTVLMYGQGEVKFFAESDASQVIIGNYFEVSFVLMNADGISFTPPKFTNFDILSGPSHSVSSSSINGRWSRELRYSYTLQPKKIGKYKIGASTITVKGKKMRSEPVAIEVLKGKSGATSQSDIEKSLESQVFIKAVPSTEVAYVGQQIVLDYKLYTTRNIDTYNLLAESEYDGFFVQDVRNHRWGTKREVVDGEQYSAKILKRVVLFPQQGGLLPIEPMEIQLAVINEDGKPRRRRSLFDRPSTTRMVVKTDPVKINVRSLPANAPETFTGAVGKFQMDLKNSSNSLSTDDVISIQMTVSGDGDIKQVQPPIFKVDDNFEAYDPRVTAKTPQEINGKIRFQKVIEYLFLPKEPGNYTISPEFTFFDPDSMRYITLAKNPIGFRIRKGNKKKSEIKLPEETTAELSELKNVKVVGALSSKDGGFVGSPIYWSLLGLPLFLLGGVVLYRQKQLKEGDVDLLLLKKQKAAAVAQQNLESAKQFLDNNDSRSFYNEVSRASLGYIGDKLNIPLSELSKANIEGQLQKLKISTPRIESFIKILKTCEMALYGGMNNTAAMNDTYASAASVISGIEEEIGA